MSLHEEWRPCPGFPSFVVSNLGRVMRSVDGAQRWSKAGKLLSPEVTKDGHLRVTLSEAGVKSRRFVHQLVCEAWHGPAPNGKTLACHRDDVKVNNSPGNLYWGSRIDNGRDSVANGRSVRGERVNTAKLDEAAVLAIREKAARGATNLALAAEFGVPDGQISKIVRGIDWKHVGGPTRPTLTRGVKTNRAYGEAEAGRAA